MPEELLRIFIMGRELLVFKPNGNKDRRDYSAMLMPPDGYTLEKAVGTTYSLDLEALTAAAICLGLSEDMDSKIMQNPISMLNALQKVSEKIVLFCEDGQIKMPAKPSSLSILLENMVVPVALPKDKGMNRYPAFHPKTWILCYQNAEGDRKYRFIILSRNLTFDRSWDISIAIDSSTKVKQRAKTKPIIHFIAFLRSIIKNTNINASKKRSILGAFQKELESVSFALDSREFGENFEILPMGIGAESYDMNDDILFCKDRNSADYTFHELVVMSPFLSSSVIALLNEKEKGLTDCKRILITRKSALGKLKKEQADNFEIFALKDEMIDGENILSDEDISSSDMEKCQQDIHAKIYLRRKYANVDLYLGSMNASYAALHKNVEMMIWLGTKNRYLNATSFLEDIFCGPIDAPSNPFERVSVMEQVEDTLTDVRNLLELKIKDLCRVSKKAVVTANADKYDVAITFEGQKREECIHILPFNSNKVQILDKQVVFEKLDILQLSEFYEIRAFADEICISRVIMIPTTGFPEERESAVVNSVVKDRRSFVEYIAFMLGEDYVISMLEDKQAGKIGIGSGASQAFPALYEKMLKAALEAPERLQDIGYILKMVTDKEIIPDEFRETYDTFCQTLRL